MDSYSTDIEDIFKLDREALVGRWREVCGSEPPVNISRPLLLRALAYRIQEKTHGGLKSATRKFLEKAAADSAAGKKIAAPRSTKSGTRLLREWHGVTHEVVMTDRGAEYRGKEYRSLSEVARVITGTRWSAHASSV